MYWDKKELKNPKNFRTTKLVRVSRFFRRRNIEKTRTGTKKYCGTKKSHLCKPVQTSWILELIFLKKSNQKNSGLVKSVKFSSISRFRRKWIYRKSVGLQPKLKIQKDGVFLFNLSLYQAIWTPYAKVNDLKYDMFGQEDQTISFFESLSQKKHRKNSVRKWNSSCHRTRSPFSACIYSKSLVPQRQKKTTYNMTTLVTLARNQQDKIVCMANKTIEKFPILWSEPKR